MGRDRNYPRSHSKMARPPWLESSALDWQEAATRRREPSKRSQGESPRKFPTACRPRGYSLGSLRAIFFESFDIHANNKLGSSSHRPVVPFPELLKGPRDPGD